LATHPIATYDLFCPCTKKYCKEVYYFTYGFDEDSRDNQGWEVDADVLHNLKILNAKKDLNLNTDELFNENTIHLTNGISKNTFPKALTNTSKNPKRNGFA